MRCKYDQDRELKSYSLSIPTGSPTRPDPDAPVLAVREELQHTVRPGLPSQALPPGGDRGEADGGAAGMWVHL